MKNENGEKGLFRRLVGNKKAKKSSCCCNVQLEELPEENTDNANAKKPAKEEDNSCCK